MSIACILGGTGERRTKTHGYRDQSPPSIAMDGNATAEAFIKHQWLPDSPKNSCSQWHLEDTARQIALPMKNHSLLALVNAARLAALGYFTVTGRIPQPWLGSVARGYLRNQSKYQFATDRLQSDRHSCTPFSALTSPTP